MNYLYVCVNVLC